MKKINTTILIIFISFFAFAQNNHPLDSPYMTHAEWLEYTDWLESIKEEENKKNISWKEYKTDWKENTTICSDFFPNKESRDKHIYGLYVHQAKIKTDGATITYDVNQTEFHKTTGEYTYDIPVGWCKKWPNKPFIKENNVESCLTVSVLSAESEDKRSKIKYDWKEYIADHDNDVKKEENLNLYNHQSIKPWYKDWPRKKY